MRVMRTTYEPIPLRKGNLRAAVLIGPALGWFLAWQSRTADFDRRTVATCIVAFGSGVFVEVLIARANYMPWTLGRVSWDSLRYVGMMFALSCAFQTLLK